MPWFLCPNSEVLKWGILEGLENKNVLCHQPWWGHRLGSSNYPCIPEPDQYLVPHKFKFYISFWFLTTPKQNFHELLDFVSWIIMEKLMIHELFPNIWRIWENCHLIGQKHFSPKLSNQKFTRYVWDFNWLIKNMNFYYKLNPKKKNSNRVFLKNQQSLFLDHFGQIPIFLKKAILLVFFYSGWVSFSKTSEKNNGFSQALVSDG